MKRTLILAALVATIGAAHAQTPTKTPAKKAPAMTNCAVMPHDKIEIARSESSGLFSDYKNKRYYFCCPGCKPTFDKDPAKYAKTAKGFPIPAKKAPAKKPA